MNYIKYFFLTCLLGGLLAGCTAVDPSVNDLKSPCVSADGDGSNPCVRRKPLENYVL